MVSRASTSNDSDDLTVWNACIEIVDATRDSLERHIPHPDQFDDEMPCYCALATFGTFLSLLVSDETRIRPILDCIRRCAAHAEIEQRGLVVMLATQRVDYGTRQFTPELAHEIVEHLTSLEPPHAPVFRDIFDIAYKKASEFATPAI
jgi:hypothetical protein